MPKISTADLQTGMVLADDLRSPQGRLLLPCGTALNDRHLTICKIWGVVEADIENVAPEDVEKQALEELDPERLAQAKRIILQRFARAGWEHPFLRELARQGMLLAAQRSCDQQASEAPELREAPAVAAPSADEILSDQIELASLPDIFHRIVEAVNNPRSSATFVADVISKDVGLSAKLLRIVNSPFFGLGQKVDTLSRAVALVGSNQLTSLAMGVSVISLFKDIPPEFMDMEIFWRHSVGCGVWARLLAGHLRLENEERWFLSGMMHDLGQLVMLKNAPAVSCSVLARISPENGVTYEVEQQLIGYDHAYLGGKLLESWNFPDELVRAVSGHHEPERQNMDQGACLVHLADIITHALQDEVGGPMDLASPLNERALETLGLNKNAIAPLIPQARHQLHEIVQTFF